MSLKQVPAKTPSHNVRAVWGEPKVYDITAARLATFPPVTEQLSAACPSQPASGGPLPVAHMTEEKSVQTAPEQRANTITPAIDSRARDQETITLVGQIAQGDQGALARLYDNTNRLVYGLILRVLGDTGAAEEVLLDVYSQVWRQAAAYDLHRGSPLAWLTTIARSRAIDRLRAGWQTQQRQESLDVVTDRETAANSPEENTVLSERQHLVKQALAQLSAEQREVIELAYYSGLSHTEIAERLGQPLGTVKTRTRLGMIKLRDALAPILGGQH